MKIYEKPATWGLILILVLCIYALSGCTTSSDPKTIAMGAEGKVDYCVDLAIIEPICVNATRVLGKAERAE